MGRGLSVQLVSTQAGHPLGLGSASLKKPTQEKEPVPKAEIIGPVV
jgi:hypothetical protein